MISAAAPIRADAGGGDAPDQLANAMPLLPGTHTGTLGTPDEQDYYVVDHPANRGVQAKLTMPNVEHVHLALLTIAGNHLDDVHVTPSWYGGSVVTATLRATSSAGAVVVLVEALEPTATTFEYVLEVTLVELPDLAVEDLIVRSVPLETDLGEVATGLQREIEVVVSNLAGNASSPGTLRVTATTISDGKTRIVGIKSVLLEAGETRRFGFSWNGAGSVGEVRFSALVTASEDLDRTNNARDERGYVLLGGTGVGATAAAGTYACTPTPLVGACGGGSAGPDSTGGFAGAYALLAGAGAGANVAPVNGGSTYAIASAGAPFVSAYVVAAPGTFSVACAYAVVVSRCVWLPA